MEKDNSTIKKELDHIRNTINQKNEIHNDSDSENFILLDKIVSKSKKYNKKTIIDNKSNKKTVDEKNNYFSTNKKIKTDSKLNIPKKNISTPIKKTKDPVEELVDREIKPIIKKWIGKNLKSFVKTIVIEEMKLISKATQKHK